MTDVTSNLTLQERIESAASTAYRGCGLSDILYESRLQAAFRGILSTALEHERDAVEAQLRKAGFDPEFKEYQAADGECDLTGIDIDHCPCGQHP
jgi:hypothetical protein